MNKATNKIEFIHMNDTSLNVKVNSINVDEGTVSHVAMISSEIYYRVEEPTSGTGTGNLHLLSFIFMFGKS